MGIGFTLATGLYWAAATRTLTVAPPVAGKRGVFVSTPPDFFEQ